MAKRGKLSQVEKFFITNNTDLPVSELAKKLDRSENSVQKVLDESTVEVDEAEEKSTQTTDSVFTGTKKGRAGALMGRHKSRKGITVMTEGASAAGDDHRDAVNFSKPTNRYTKDSIHKPMGDSPRELADD